jgi:hypothetical protein
MSTAVLGGIAVGFFMLYLMRRRSRLRAEEDNF